MTVQEVCDELGLDKETAKLVIAQAKAEKAAAMKQQRELDTIEAKRAELEAELVADGKKGARNYKLWYEENFPKIQKLQGDYAKYVERYGAIDPAANPNPANQNSNPTGHGVTLEDAKKAANELIANNYGPQWSNLLKGSGKILEKHLRAKRDNEIDWDKLSELAATKGGDLVAAYDEWDKPARDAANKRAEDDRVNKRVEDELKKRSQNTFFPSTEQTPSGISPLSKDRGDTASKYDRSKVVESAITGLYEPATVQ